MISVPMQSSSKDSNCNNDTKVVPSYDPNRQSFLKPKRRSVRGGVNVAERVSARAIAGSNFNQSSLRLNTGNIKTLHLGIMMSMVQDPIQCGYLLHFSTLEHNAENLCFIMMVSRFRDAVCQDNEAWPKTWEQVDMEIQGQDEDELSLSTRWPSKRLHRPNIQKLVDVIFDTYLSDESIAQICMPAKVALNTERRMLLLDLYGPEVFQESLLDPIKTINKDVLPRFLASPIHTEMANRMESLKTRLTINDVKVPPPTDNALLNSKQTFTEKRSFTLKDFIDNSILYNEFIKYLESIFSAEYLLCARMIDIFEVEITNQSTVSIAKATDCAWLIFRYFAAKDAPYEVSLHSRHKKELMISLAKVHMQMFDELKKSVMSVLTVKFNTYKSTESYRGLWKLMKKEQSKSSFFGFLFL